MSVNSTFPRILACALALTATAGISVARAAGSDVGSSATPGVSPPAQVFEESYEGPPVVGDGLTLAPDLAPLAPGNRTWEVRIDVVVREIEIAPGVRYQAWTFGGSVPGPVLHVRQGDRVKFTLRNRSGEVVAVTPPEHGGSLFLDELAQSDLQKGRSEVMPMPHGIDFHAAQVAPNDKWRPIQPGESIRFEWTANYPGVFIYHCSQPPVLQHLSMGQYGVVVVSPKDGYPTDSLVDREYVVVQSEFYLAQGEDGLWALDFPAALAKQPSQVAFNGHVSSLIDRPLKANAGDRVRLYVLNVGPNDTSSIHVIGTILDRVYYDGNPANVLTGLQTVLLGASNGAVVEFVVPEPGVYTLVDHEFADATKGAMGRIVVGPAKTVTQPSGN
jgi:nitrite reductase (NO-forming)